MEFISKANLGICEHCHEKPATGEFTYAGHLRGARRWHLCERCVQQFASGMPSGEDLRQKAGSAGGTVWGWTSYPPLEKPKDEDSSP